MYTTGQVPAKLHRIKLSKSERHELEAFRDQKSDKASGIMRAVALLLSDERPQSPAMKAADSFKSQVLKVRLLNRKIFAPPVFHASILLRKRREGAHALEHLASLAEQFHDDCKQLLIHFRPLTEAVMTRLESVLAVAPAATNIRAAGALYLACAAEHGFTEVYSNDLLLAAAPLFGLRGANVIATL